jgi:meso-butanediol dehydrogenase/(S,S)-butanediol dehydrogenase/diacetyl reductase
MTRMDGEHKERMKLNGKIAIVTGAGAGIGRATSLLFARQGAKVVAVDLVADGILSLVKEIHSAGGTAEAIVADVSSAADVEQCIQKTLGKFERIDILFNNAGIVIPGKIHEISEPDWDRSMDVNVKSMYLMCRNVVPVFRKQGGGVILNTSSAVVLRTVVDRAVYTAAKGAVLAMTRSMALDYVKDGIRVNCLCPGTVDTPSWQHRLAALGGDPVLARKQFEARQPMGRLGTAEEIAEAALYLVSDAAKFVTGGVFPIDGGFSL